MQPQGARTHSLLHTRCARTRTQTDQEARTNTRASADTRERATTRINKHTFLPRDMQAIHAMASAAALICAATEGERHGRMV
jgi:hypothetical protein